MLVELDGVAVNTDHVAQCRIVDCSIRWRLVSDGPMERPSFSPTAARSAEIEFPHGCSFPSFDEAAEAYRTMIESSGFGS